jgi:hypothetical protein
MRHSPAKVWTRIMADGGRDACLLDSNILPRVSKSDDPHHSVVVQALKTQVAQGSALAIRSQTLAEFWNASTRHASATGMNRATSLFQTPLEGPLRPQPTTIGRRHQRCPAAPY